MVRLRGKKTEAGPVVESPAGGESRPTPALYRPVSHRSFLKLLITGAGLAAVAESGQLALAPRAAFAEIVQNDDVRITGKLTVQGAADSSFAANLGVGTTTPGGRLDTKGGYLALDNGGFGNTRGLRFRNTGDTTTPNGGGLAQPNNDEFYVHAGPMNIINFMSVSSLMARFDNRYGGTLLMPLGGAIRPWNGDSAQALHITNYEGWAYVTFDSSNKRVGLGTTAPETRLHLSDGSIKIGQRVIADSGGSYYAP